MKNRINTAKSRLFASHELYSVVKDQDYQVLVIDAEIDTFGVTIIITEKTKKLLNKTGIEKPGDSIIVNLLPGFRTLFFSYRHGKDSEFYHQSFRNLL